MCASRLDVNSEGFPFQSSILCRFTANKQTQPRVRRLFIRDLATVSSCRGARVVFERQNNEVYRIYMSHSPVFPRLVCLFLKRGADYNARDKNQKDPITIAVDNANADIVTL